MSSTDTTPGPGASVLGSGGEMLGTVEAIYDDNETGQPAWAAVRSDSRGGHVSLVPLTAAEQSGADLRVPYSEEQVKAAPHHDPGRELSASDEAELFRHYGVAYANEPVTPQPHRRAAPQPAGSDDDAMTRSEERLYVGTEQVETGRARLRKRIVAENVSVVVPVSHEQVRVVREPITDARRGQATSGPELSEEEHEVTLHAERAVVRKETVPVERVRLATETVTEQQQVNETIRKEQIDQVEETVERPRRPRR